MYETTAVINSRTEEFFEARDAEIDEMAAKDKPGSPRWTVFFYEGLSDATYTRQPDGTWLLTKTGPGYA